MLLFLSFRLVCHFTSTSQSQISAQLISGLPRPIINGQVLRSCVGGVCSPDVCLLDTLHAYPVDMRSAQISNACAS